MFYSNVKHEKWEKMKTNVAKRNVIRIHYNIFGAILFPLEHFKRFSYAVICINGMLARILAYGTVVDAFRH